MEIPTWGSSPKSQEDATTIDEAIAIAIAEHESDPIAHLGAGESLEQHKTNEVIDHPALSIVADKMSNADNTFFIPVLPIDPDFVENLWAINETPFLFLGQDDSFTNDGLYFISQIEVYNYGYTDGDVIHDFLIWASGEAGTWNVWYDFSFGALEIEEGRYKIHLHTGVSPYFWVSSEWITHDVTKGMRFRFFYNSLENMMYVYLRDVLVFSLSHTINFADDTFITQFFINRGTSTNFRTYIGNCQVWFNGV